MKLDLKTLCATYAPLTPSERIARLFEDFDRVLVTSSFGTTSVVLLHHLHKIKPEHPIHFIDTSYHFQETHGYRQQLTKAWNLNVISVHPRSIENRYTQLSWTWTYAPDDCCGVNKVQPVNELKAHFDVWISGMMGGTTRQREQLDVFAHDGDILRFYPFIDMKPQEAEWYKIVHDLPRHPLESKGYGSIGCVHCTRKGDGRSGRWQGKQKTECGLHMFKAG